MARADLLCELIKAGLRKDDMTFRRATQAICAEERTKQHEILANKIEQLLKENPEQTTYTSRNPSMHTINSINSIPKHLFHLEVELIMQLNLIFSSREEEILSMKIICIEVWLNGGKVQQGHLAFLQQHQD